MVIGESWKVHVDTCLVFNNQAGIWKVFTVTSKYFKSYLVKIIRKSNKNYIIIIVFDM